jgi:hypothetical protein
MLAFSRILFPSDTEEVGLHIMKIHCEGCKTKNFIPYQSIAIKEKQCSAPSSNLYFMPQICFQAPVDYNFKGMY